MKKRNREQWLEELVELLRPLFKRAGFPFGKVRITCGFPCRRATAGKNQRIGECHGKTSSAGNYNEIFISPILHEQKDITDTVAHELAHAAVGVEAGHKGEFLKCCKAVGLTEGKPTSVNPGKELSATIKKLAKPLGRYPHKKLEVGGNLKKQGTRLIKVACPECGCTVRITRKWLDETGAPYCGCDPIANQMEEDV